VAFLGGIFYNFIAYKERSLETEEQMSKMAEARIIQELTKFDTATICNVVASHAGSDICLNLYDAWRGQYYTDQTLHCMYPEVGLICGYAATAWYSEASVAVSNRNKSSFVHGVDP
jgi:hypothetical protein